MDTPTKGRGGYSRMTVSSTAVHTARAVRVPAGLSFCPPAVAGFGLPTFLALWHSSSTSMPLYDSPAWSEPRMRGTSQRVVDGSWRPEWEVWTSTNQRVGDSGFCPELEGWTTHRRTTPRAARAASRTRSPGARSPTPTPRAASPRSAASTCRRAGRHRTQPGRTALRASGPACSPDHQQRMS